MKKKANKKEVQKRKVLKPSTKSKKAKNKKSLSHPVRGKKKLSDNQFFTILRENAGLFARTARAIKTQFGIEYTRQSVRERAMNSPDILEDIEEQNIDIAEEGLHSLMRSKSENIKFKSIEMFLETKGKKRGYVKKTEMEQTTTHKTANFDLSKLSDSELEELVKLQSKIGVGPQGPS